MTDPLPKTRVSDEEREQTVTALRTHYTAGRLQLDEFRERVDRAYAAVTRGELNDVVQHLPQPGMSTTAPAPRRSLQQQRLFWFVGRFAVINAACLGVYLASGANGDFWPKWVLIASGVILARRVLALYWPGRSDDFRGTRRRTLERHRSLDRQPGPGHDSEP